MSRRGKGEGSIRLRADGRWEATLTLAPKAGKRQRRSFFAKTRAEVARKLREAQRRLDEDLPLPSAKLTIASYLPLWLDGKRDNLRPRTWKRYDDICRLHLIPELGKHVLSKLQPADLREAYGAIASKVSGTTVAHAHGVLHVALRDAEREGLVGRNVASLVTAPRRTTGEQRHLGAEDARQLLEVAKGHPLEAFIVLALTAGLRLGELQALRWVDVDTRRQRVRVVRTLTGQQAGIPTFGEPKTQHSRRTVWLAATACGALEAHREKQAELRRTAEEAWQEYGLVFTNALGKPVDGSHILSRVLHPLLEQAGLPRMRFHDLRHTAASILLAEGTPIKVVSELLGHSDIAVTLRIYAHTIEGAQEQAVSVMDRLFHA